MAENQYSRGYSLSMLEASRDSTNPLSLLEIPGLPQSYGFPNNQSPPGFPNAQPVAGFHNTPSLQGFHHIHPGGHPNGHPAFTSPFPPPHLPPFPPNQFPQSSFSPNSHPPPVPSLGEYAHAHHPPNHPPNHGVGHPTLFEDHLGLYLSNLFTGGPPSGLFGSFASSNVFESELPLPELSLPDLPLPELSLPELPLPELTHAELGLPELLAPEAPSRKSHPPPNPPLVPSNPTVPKRKRGRPKKVVVPNGAPVANPAPPLAPVKRQRGRPRIHPLEGAPPPRRAYKKSERHGNSGRPKTKAISFIEVLRQRKLARGEDVTDIVDFSISDVEFGEAEAEQPAVPERDLELDDDEVMPAPSRRKRVVRQPPNVSVLRYSPSQIRPPPKVISRAPLEEPQGGGTGPNDPLEEEPRQDETLEKKLPRGGVRLSFTKRVKRKDLVERIPGATRLPVVFAYSIAELTPDGLANYLASALFLSGVAPAQVPRKRGRPRKIPLVVTEAPPLVPDPPIPLHKNPQTETTPASIGGMGSITPTIPLEVSSENPIPAEPTPLIHPSVPSPPSVPLAPVPRKRGRPRIHPIGYNAKPKAVPGRTGRPPGRPRKYPLPAEDGLVRKPFYYLSATSKNLPNLPGLFKTDLGYTQCSRAYVKALLASGLKDMKLETASPTPPAVSET